MSRVITNPLFNPNEPRWLQSLLPLTQVRRLSILCGGDMQVRLVGYLGLDPFINLALVIAKDNETPALPF
jgi:hypothetical protein